ncbi:MAG: adenylate/guanylate cyclase domain-containing protein [Longimicrobiales bacterium]
MTAKNRLFLEETLISIGLMTAAMYVYYVVGGWGLSDHFADGVFKDYLTGPGVQLELAISGVGMGLLLALVNRWSESPRVRRWPFGRIVLLKTAAYVGGLLLVGGVVNGALALFVFSPDEMRDVWGTLSFRLMVSVGGWILLSVFAVNFLLEVRKKVGPGNLTALFTGRYQRPRSEHRVFLFVDLKGSTTIAESLGHERYSRFIQECFHDLSDAVLRYGARIYQYVGDEAVLTWSADEEGAKVSCMETFFAFQEKLHAKRDWYQQRFGVSPEFRAGIESGRVTVAEVGDIKREIAYHGDPLNTAARLLELCKDYDQNVLVSGDFGQAVDAHATFSTEWQADVVLRGKREPLPVYGVRQVPLA